MAITTEWKDEIFKRLDAIAAKLGVAAGELWRVLLQQAKVEAYCHLFYIGMGAIFIFGALWLIKKARALADDVECLWFGIPGVIGGIAGIVMVLVNIYNLWTPLLNPEFWALTHIISSLSGRE